MTRLTADIRSTFTAAGANPFTVDAAIEVESNETCVVLGPSGSGKTLLLETIAGFHDHDGSVTANGTDISTDAPENRGFGFVFQDYALFPHMTVRENVEYGTRYQNSSRDADELLSELGVAHLAERNPPTLSGGEKQRVALARALAIRPSVMLLDEPLAALDVPTQQALRDDLADVLTDVTAVYVTHDRTTARAIADRIVVMHDGEIVQRGSPDEVFERPTSPMVAKFTGANTIDLSATASLRALLNGEGTDDGQVTIRPEAISLNESNGDIRATVERVIREDATHRVTLSFDNVSVDAFSSRSPNVGDEVWLAFSLKKLHRI